MSLNGTISGGRRAWLSSRSGILKGGRLLISLAVTMLGLLLITFLIGRVMPIDPVLAVVGERATNEVYEATRKAMGLDDPLIVQFWNYVTEVLRGDFGTSLLTSRPVIEDIARVFALWRRCLARHGGPFLFGEWSAADIFFAPVAARFRSYLVVVPGDLAVYSEAVLSHPHVREWEAEAVREPWTVEIG